MIDINKLNEKQMALVDDLAEDLKETVREIEKGIETTKNRYGNYGSIISSLCGGNRNNAWIIGLAMERAGGNPQGISDGIRCFC